MRCMLRGCPASRRSSCADCPIAGDRSVERVDRLGRRSLGRDQEVVVRLTAIDELDLHVGMIGLERVAQTVGGRSARRPRRGTPSSARSPALNFFRPSMTAAVRSRSDASRPSVGPRTMNSPWCTRCRPIRASRTAAVICIVWMLARGGGHGLGRLLRARTRDQAQAVAATPSAALRVGTTSTLTPWHRLPACLAASRTFELLGSTITSVHPRRLDRLGQLAGRRIRALAAAHDSRAERREDAGQAVARRNGDDTRAR